jgi:hypothetical protein
MQANYSRTLSGKYPPSATASVKAKEKAIP